MALDIEGDEEFTKYLRRLQNGRYNLDFNSSPVILGGLDQYLLEYVAWKADR